MEHKPASAYSEKLFKMDSIQIFGVEGYTQTVRLKENVMKALNALNLDVEVTEVNDVEELLLFKIRSIPALVINNQIISQKIIPEVEDLKVLFQSLFHPANYSLAIKKILVPTDFSPAAKKAFEYALNLGNHHHAEVEVLHVTPASDDIANTLYPDNQSFSKNKNKNKLTNFIRRDPANTNKVLLTVPPVKTKNISGPTVETIVNFAKAEAIDLIVMGLSGEGGLKKNLLGSISAKVAQQATCPVLLVPQKGSFHPFNHILYASDHHPSDEVLLTQLISFAERYNSTIHFVHVNTDTVVPYHNTEKIIFEKILQSGAPNISIQYAPIKSPEIINGLTKYARVYGIDLIVMGTSHRNFLQDFFHKSTTKRMIMETEVPVLVMHFDE